MLFVDWIFYVLLGSLSVLALLFNCFLQFVKPLHHVLVPFISFISLYIEHPLFFLTVMNLLGNWFLLAFIPSINLFRTKWSAKCKLSLPIFLLLTLFFFLILLIWFRYDWFLMWLFVWLLRVANNRNRNSFVARIIILFIFSRGCKHFNKVFEIYFFFFFFGIRLWDNFIK